MKYNCLRINQYVKMFVVGLLLYFGETVFQNATEETFTLYVKTLTGTIIKVSGCKKNDMLSGFMKKSLKRLTLKKSMIWIIFQKPAISCCTLAS